MDSRSEIDQDKLEAYVKRVSGSISAGFNCAISSVGDRLGLYRTLEELGPATSVELAEATGYNERWVREWLRHQACVEQLDYDPASDRFQMSPEAVAVLLDEGMPTYMAGGFDGVVATFPSLSGLQDAFSTGIGVNYDEHGPTCACGIERLSAHLQKFELVPTILPMLDGVTEKLGVGAEVADVGCGGAQSTIAMAKAFPNSRFVGYDISEHALVRARSNVEDSGLANVEIRDPEKTPLPADGSLDFVTTFDVVHDTPYPDRLIAAIHRALKDDGTWLCEDIRSFPSFEQNLNEHPIASLLYGFSIMVCMSSGLSTADGAGLGTLGFNHEVARDMTLTAGFSRFQRLDYDNVFNSYYEIRK